MCVGQAGVQVFNVVYSMHAMMITWKKFYQNSGSSCVYSNRTLHPSVLDRKTVSVCFSWPSGTTG